MSLVTVQLGQCGNQVGGALFEMLCREIETETSSVKDFSEYALDAFFRYDHQGKRVARSVMIDMEPKVIQQTSMSAQKSGMFQYDSSAQYFKQSGSANNWAYGFNVHGPNSYLHNCSSNQFSVQDIIRKEVERCDYFGGFMLMSSLAGGTGSGLGAYIAQNLRDEYERSFIVNQVVWPYSSGEVIVQNYNTILTLSTLLEHSDAVIMFDNDMLNLTCNRLLNIPSPSFQDMNQVISNALANILLPSYLSSIASDNLLRRQSWMQLWADPLRTLCSHPGYRLLTTKAIPQISTKSKQYSSFMWQGLLKHLHQMLIADAKIEEKINWSIKLPDVHSSYRMSALDRSRSSHVNKSVSNLLILRGQGLNEITQDTIDKFRHPLAYAPWVEKKDRLMLSTIDKNFNKFDKSAVLLSNSQSVVVPLDRTLQKASEMFHSKAYVHQYEKYGIGTEEFIHHFTQMEQVLYNYKNLG